MSSSNIKIAYVTPVNFTLTGIGGLANSASPGTAGLQSTVIDNSSNLYTDAHVGGKIQVGTTPTAGNVIEVFAFAAIDYNVPTYPDVLGATAATVTFTTRDILVAVLVPLATIVVTDNTSNRNFYFGVRGIASRFDGGLPAKWGIVIINSSGVALHTTDGNHVITYTPIYYTVG